MGIRVRPDVLFLKNQNILERRNQELQIKCLTRTFYVEIQ